MSLRFVSARQLCATHQQPFQSGWRCYFHPESLGANPWAAMGRGTCSAQDTLAYMAPEVMYNNSAEYASDIYSLGITAIELLTGVPDPDPRRLITAVIPEELRQMLSAMVFWSPHERPAAASVVEKLWKIERTAARATTSDWTSLWKAAITGLVIAGAASAMSG